MPLPSRKLAALVAAGALLALGAVLVLRSPARPVPVEVHPPPPPPPPASLAPPTPPPATASPAELAVVAPLAPGSELRGFTVREIGGVERGRMRVVCAKGREVVRLEVALDGGEGAVPPATAGGFAIFYSLHGATPEDGERLAKALASVIGRGKAPPPPGMTTFTPEPKPPTPI